MSARPLPTLTSDVEVAKQDMDEHGYAILADALPFGTIDAMVERMYDQAAGEAKAGALPKIADDAAAARSFKQVAIGKTEGAFDVHGETAQARVFSLLNKGTIWRAMIDPTDKVHQVLEYIFTPSFDAESAATLEQKYLLSSTQAKFKHRDTHYTRRAFHTDQRWMAGHQPYPVVATCFYLLSDFNIENGCTWVVPGSHKLPPLPMKAYYTTPEGAAMIDKAVPIVAPKGSAFLFDGRICHAEGVNTSGEVRIHLNNYHCAPYMRQRELFSMNLRQDVIDELSTAQLKLLGFESSFLYNLIEPTLGRRNVGGIVQPLSEILHA
jgi:ectoine hydroxylase-related dioxygenase (phytanoyl-CoA dioxygenase family)